MSIVSSVTTRSGKPEIKSENMGTLLDKNHLKYSIPASLSVSVQRRMVSSPAQSQTYKSRGHVNVTSLTGDDFVNGRGSYIAFDLKRTDAGVTNDAKFNSFKSSAIDLIQTLTLYHSSGVEIERLEEVGLYRRVIDAYKRSASYHGSELSTTAKDQVITTAGNKIVIPLKHLSGLFDLDVLLPPYLMSGLRFSIDLASASRALIGTDGNKDYQIENVEIVFDSITLADNVVKELNSVSAKSGTELTWESYENTAKTITTGTLNMSADRAVSRANMAFAVTRLVANLDDEKKDSLSPEEFKVANYQFRLGSQFFPNKQLEDKVQMYRTALNTFRAGGEGTVTLGTFTQAAQCDGVMCASLERDDLLDLSGLPVSSSRSLTVNAKYDDALNRQVNLFMSFVKVMKLFLYDRVQVLE